MVEQVESKFPAVRYQGGGSRAVEAAKLVSRQAVEFLGDQGGRDYWRVDGRYTCSIKGVCNCADHGAPLDQNGRKLCKHMLAVMFAYKLRQERSIVRILQGAPAECGRVDLRVQVLYADKGRQYTLDGWRYFGQDWQTLEYADRLRFDEAEFLAAMRLAGFGMTQRPVRGGGMTYRYTLERGAEVVFGAGAMTGEDVDRVAQRQRIEEIAGLHDGAADGEIMQGLPVAVQATILEHAGASR